MRQCAGILNKCKKCQKRGVFMSKIPTCLTKRHFQNNVVYFRTTVDCVVNGTATILL